jgi:hypothetical protein
MLPAELKARALRRAKDKGVSFGSIVRESLELALNEEISVVDCFFADSAVYKGKAPSDLSSRHDDYLYGDKE